MVLTVVASDSTQYYAGRLFGRTLLAPAISPKKTVEGAIGGFVGGAVAMAWLGGLWLPAMPLGTRLALALVLVTLGIVGDLLESVLKRAAQVKDSSQLIPGHGGVLDRIDALLLVIPVYYVALRVASRGDVVKRIAILGSTGSIGTSALAVIDAHPDRLQVVGLAAGRSAEALAAQMQRYRPAIVAIGDAEAVPSLSAAAPAGTRVRGGADGLIDVATHPDVDILLCASSGTTALEAVLAAIDAGKTIALANKEVLVMAGELVTTAARARGVALLPVDSEHNAIHQCLHGRGRPRSPETRAHRLGRPVSHLAGRSPPDRPSRRRAAAPDVADGPQDHHRLGDADEQGPRGHRGALAVRRSRQPHRGRRASRSRSCTRWWS